MELSNAARSRSVDGDDCDCDDASAAAGRVAASVEETESEVSSIDVDSGGWEAWRKEVEEERWEESLIIGNRSTSSMSCRTFPSALIQYNAQQFRSDVKKRERKKKVAG
jgi:hypothetical protein